VSNKINDLTSRPTTVGAGSPVAKVRDVVTGGSGGSATSSSDDVHITDSASKLAALEQALRGLPAVNEARVAEVSSAIEQGRYTVQPDRIADKLIQLERDLGRLPNTGGSE
jgi:negative regulator of flagellin synthesis FlgM